MSKKESNTIKDFIEGRLNESDRRSVSERIKTYQKNKQEEMNKHIKTKKFNSDKAWESLHVRFEENGLLTNRKKNFILSPAFKIAASIIIIIGLSLSALYIYNSDNYVEIASLNEIIEQKLPDGTIVTLNTNSNLKYPESFKGNFREIDFNGEAFFEVAKNPNMPFIINANGAKVKVLGTSFNLNTNSYENIVLAVTTGKVQLAKSTDPEQSVILNAGDIGKISNSRLSSEINEDANYSSWKTKKLYFKQGETLNKIISDLIKTYHVVIEFEDNLLGNKKTSEINFDNKSLNHILDVYCNLYFLEYKTVGEKIIVSKK